VPRVRALMAARTGPEKDVDAIEKRMREEIEGLASRVWSRAKLPEIAKWLDGDAVPLAKFIEASQKPRYFSPLVPSAQNPGLSLVPSDDCEIASDMAAMLVARAMLSLGEKKFSDAGRDLYACHRLARLIAQGPSTADLLAAMNMDQLACFGDVTLSLQAGLGADRIKKYLVVLRQMGPLSGMAEKIDFGQRLALLDAASRLARTGPATIFRLEAEVATSPDEKRLLENPMESSRHWNAAVSLDWNEVLKLLNARMDRLAAALRTADHNGRDKAVAFCEQDVADARAAAQRHFRQPQNANALLRGMVSPGTTPALFADWLTCVMLRSPSALAANEDLCATYWQLDRLALALGAYRSDRRSYPKSLAELAPKYLEEVPNDPFSGDNFHYEGKPDSFVLYSVGLNHRDDGGRGVGEGPDADDIVIRVAPSRWMQIEK